MQPCRVCTPHQSSPIHLNQVNKCFKAYQNPPLSTTSTCAAHLRARRAHASWAGKSHRRHAVGILLMRGVSSLLRVLAVATLRVLPLLRVSSATRRPTAPIAAGSHAPALLSSVCAYPFRIKRSCKISSRYRRADQRGRWPALLEHIHKHRRLLLIHLRRKSKLVSKAQGGSRRLQHSAGRSSCMIADLPRFPCIEASEAPFLYHGTVFTTKVANYSLALVPAPPSLPLPISLPLHPPFWRRNVRRSFDSTSNSNSSHFLPSFAPLPAKADT